MIGRNKIYPEASSSAIRAENLSGKNISTSVHKISEFPFNHTTYPFHFQKPWEQS